MQTISCIFNPAIPLVINSPTDTSMLYEMIYAQSYLLSHSLEEQKNGNNLNEKEKRIQ